MTRIPVALFNIQSGCLRQGGNGYDFERLQRAAAHLTEPPALWLLNEAKQWRADANHGLHGAAEALSDTLGVPYTGLLGTSDRGSIPPAIAYDSNQLVLRSWWNPDDPYSYLDKLNVARFAIRNSAPTAEHRTEFLAWVAHWHPDSATIRQQEATHIARYGHRTHLPVIGGGDLNNTASGPHLPQYNWTLANHQRRAAEAHQLPDGTWTTNTDAVDHLIGPWDTHHHKRIGGSGYHAIAELAWQAGITDALVPTVNTLDSGGAVIKDWLLVNPTMLPYVDPDSYHVHIPPDDPTNWPSDHRLITATLDFAQPSPPHGQQS